MQQPWVQHFSAKFNIESAILILLFYSRKQSETPLNIIQVWLNQMDADPKHCLQQAGIASNNLILFVQGRTILFCYDNWINEQ
jgi:hypothetical protein